MASSAHTDPSGFVQRGSVARLSLRARVTLIYALVFVCTSVLALAHLTARHQQMSSEQADNWARAIAGSVGLLSQAEVAANDPIALVRRLETFSELDEIRMITLTDRQGQALAHVERNPAGNLVAAHAGPELSKHLPSNRILLSEQGTHHILWRPIGEIAPIGWIRLEYLAHGPRHVQKAYLLEAGAIIAVMTLLTTLLLYWLTGRALRPPSTGSGDTPH